MSDFRRRYHDTFDDVHAPDSVRQEVISMRDSIERSSRASNRTVETSEAEAPRRFSPRRVLAVATCCVALAVGGGVGYGYLAGHGSGDVSTGGTSGDPSDATPPLPLVTEGSGDASTGSTLGDSIDSWNSPAVTVDDGSASTLLEDAFGVSLDSLDLQGSVKVSEFEMGGYCTSSEGVRSLLDRVGTVLQGSTSFERLSEEESAELPVYEELSLPVVQDGTYVLDGMVFTSLVVEAYNRDTATNDTVLLEFFSTDGCESIRESGEYGDVYVLAAYLRDVYSEDHLPEEDVAYYRTDYSTYREVIDAFNGVDEVYGSASEALQYLYDHFTCEYDYGVEMDSECLVGVDYSEVLLNDLDTVRVYRYSDVVYVELDLSDVAPEYGTSWKPCYRCTSDDPADYDALMALLPTF